MLIKLPTPLFMADISRAMSTPPPGTNQQPAPAPAPQPAPPSIDENVKREAKNERDRLARKAKRAADLKAAQAAVKKKAASAKKKKVKALKPKKRGRGRPPGAKNKPKDAAAIMAPLLAAPVTAKSDLLLKIGHAVSLINSLSEHARKVVLDAVK